LVNVPIHHGRESVLFSKSPEFRLFYRDYVLQSRKYGENIRIRYLELLVIL